MRVSEIRVKRIRVNQGLGVPPKMLFLFLLWILFEFNVRPESIREGTLNAVCFLSVRPMN